MPCSCGNTTCPCGIPCYCLEKSCKCQDCAIAVHRFCKICNKPLITDIQTDKEKCSCYVRDSTVLILENRDNPQRQMGNIHMPVGNFVHGKLIVNAMIPIMRFPQFIPHRPISLMPPPSIQTDSRDISPSFISNLDVVTPFPPGEESGIPSTAKLHQLLDKSNGQSSYDASSGICSTGAQNTEIFCKETCTPLVLQSTDEREIANIVQNTKSEIEERAIVQESSFYLPSRGIGNISYPVWLADPVWRFPNPAFCIAGSPGSSLKLCNPFYVNGPVHTIQTMTTSEKKCRQQAPNLNFDSNGLAQEDSVTILHTSEQPLNMTKITEQSVLEMHDQRVKFEASSAFATGNEFTAHPSSRNSEAIAPIEPSNEISENYVMHDKQLAAVSTDISSSGVQELSGIQSQPVCALSTAASRKNDCLQACPVGCSIAMAISTGEERQNINFRSPHQIPTTTQSIPQYFAAPTTTTTTTSKLQPPFKKFSAQSSEENEYPQSGNPWSAFVNSKIIEEWDSIPLYIDTSTTRKMKKILKPDKY